MVPGITIYRGTHQIGGCVTEIEAGSERIIIDFGANLPGNKAVNVMSDEEIVEKVFPKDGNKKKCLGVFFTHYHGDHYGLYQKVPEDVPMYIGSTAKKILSIIVKRLDYVNKEKGLERIKSMKTYKIGRWMELSKELKLMPLVVDHSALDSYMFLIQAGEKRILFTGDFRDHGIAGQNNNFEKLIKGYVGKVDVLITEGTMLSRIPEAKCNPIQTEDHLGKKAAQIFSEHHENVVLVSSTNLDSIMKFYHATPNNKAFVCDEYQAEIMLTAIKDKGKYYKDYKLDKIRDITRNFYIVGPMRKLKRGDHCMPVKWDILKDKGFVMLARPNRNPQKEKNMFEELVDQMEEPYIIYSMWSKYLEKDYADEALIKFVEGHDMEQLHTSGHAYVETIARLIDWVQPEIICPMHTECADNFTEIKEFLGYEDRVHVLTDGEAFALK